MAGTRPRVSIMPRAMPCTDGWGAEATALEAPPDPDAPDALRVVLRVVDAREALARAVVLRRVVVVDLLLATGVTSTVAEDAAASALLAAGLAAELDGDVLAA